MSKGAKESKQRKAARSARYAVRRLLVMSPDLDSEATCALEAALAVLERFRRPAPAHGEIRTYARGCRCDACKAANRARTYAAHDAMKARGLAPDDWRHGTRGAYSNWGCRCDACTAANSGDCKARYAARKRVAS